MENAIWHKENITATQVVEFFELETQIRIASRNKELRCSDTGCSNPILKFCFGEKKRAYFSHISNCNCDYAKFDQSNTEEIRSVRKALHDHFQNSGYYVEEEVKVLPHHYTHLLISLEYSKKIAIEFVSQSTSNAQMIRIANEYKSNGIAVVWMVVGDHKIDQQDIKSMSFKKRFSINESNCLLILNPNGNDISQYVLDRDSYQIDGKEIKSQNYPPIYSESSTIDNLVFENYEITILGFYDRYNKWHQKKTKAFNKLKEERPRHGINLIHKRSENSISYGHPNTQTITDSNEYRTVLLNSDEPVYQDNYPIRLCMHCNKVKKAMRCDPYTFYYGSSNLGLCKECKNNNQPQTVFKDV